MKEDFENSEAGKGRSMHWNGEDDWRPLLKDLLANGAAGILSTTDEMGRPRLRWMSTISAEYFPCLYALTSADSRKVRDIRRNPEVSWLFCNEDHSLIVSLNGRARVLTDEASQRSIYREIPEEKRALFVDQYLVGESVALETKVETVEVTSPTNYFRYVGPAVAFDEERKQLKTFEDRSNLRPIRPAAAR